ncbi:uncharacterized protein FPRO_10338 [Fusarium proliferatum ET1]|uniref:Uncharacterized protein n=1 Tax=Fusarium proliferatum (strain ET1) TaxID=1227346 RepID=A0A1L7VM26_FUSPR|nr:uncharacterized protein FPRO_10338 [Fusarium proliferatum ET1]CZR40750.1 uncharacterized protein FPRO_10338 [Fusarium proliferatum ET1]
MSSQRVTFDPAQLPDPGNLGQRRGYIEQYIQRFHRDLAPNIAARREAAIPAVCKQYHEKLREIQAPAVYFEYAVDKTMWKNIFKPQKPPAWPWSNGPSDKDMSLGWSRTYREWRLQNGLPVPPQQEAGPSSGKGKAAEKTPVVTKPAAPKQPQTGAGSSGGKGKATEKTTKVTNPPASNPQTRNGESSKSKPKPKPKSDAEYTVRITKEGTPLRLDKAKKAWVRVPARLAGLKMTPMAAIKDLPEGPQSLFNSLGKELRESLVESVQSPAGTAPEAPTVVTAPKAPSAASAPSTKGNIDPVEIDFSLREAAWDYMYGKGYYLGGAVFAPFALRIPRCLDFKDLVLGEDGRDIEAINNDILEAGLAVSWKTHDNQAIALVVGFKDEASRALPGAMSGLADLWCDVVAWYINAVAGGTMTLATTLRVVQVVSWSRERAANFEHAQAAYYFARDNCTLISEQVRMAREDIRKWSPMLKAIIEKPLGEAEPELKAWVCNNDVDIYERSKRLRVAHQVWLSSSMDAKVIRRATHCLDDCSLSLYSA